MKSLDDQLKELHAAGIISYDAMIEMAQDPKELANRAAKPTTGAPVLKK